MNDYYIDFLKSICYSLPIIKNDRERDHDRNLHAKGSIHSLWLGCYAGYLDRPADGEGTGQQKQKKITENTRDTRTIKAIWASSCLNALYNRLVYHSIKFPLNHQKHQPLSTQESAAVSHKNSC